MRSYSNVYSTRAGLAGLTTHSISIYPMRLKSDQMPVNANHLLHCVMRLCGAAYDRLTVLGEGEEDEHDATVACIHAFRHIDTRGHLGGYVGIRSGTPYMYVH